MNSFRFLRQAIDYEIERQSELLRSGGRVTLETRTYDPQTGQTRALRSKEEAHDYRYFPEPDLPVLRVSSRAMDRARSSCNSRSCRRPWAKALRQGWGGAPPERRCPHRRARAG